MRSGKKFATAFLPTIFILLAFVVTACGGTGGNTGPGSTQSTKATADKQVLIDAGEFAGLSDLSTLDPALDPEYYSEYADFMMFTGLVTMDDSGKIIPALATSWTPSADHKTWTFKLRDGIKFSDGTPITSTDVVYSMNRALDPATKSPSAGYYMSLILDQDKFQDPKSGIKTLIGDSLLAPNPQTVVIKINKAAAYFLDTLTFPTSYVVEKAAIDKYGADWTQHLDTMGGSGPWLVKEHTPNKLISFVPNPNYYGQKPQLRLVVFPFTKESDTTYKEYKANQVDVSTVPSALLDEAKALKPDKQYYQDSALQLGYYIFNWLAKPFDNLKIRQAFSLAIDRVSISHNIFKDREVGSFHLVPQGMPGYSPDLTGPAGVKSASGDPAMAKQLFEAGLAEEGMTRTTMPPIVIETSAVSTAARNELAAEQQMWKQALGIDVRFNNVDFNQLNKDSLATQGNGKLMAWSIGWAADYPDPQDWITLQFGKGELGNVSNYGSTPEQQQLQARMAAADIDPDPTARLQSYNQIEQELVNEVAYMTLYQQTISGIRKPCVVGIQPNPFQLTPPDDWGNIYMSTAQPCANTDQYK